MNAAGRRSFGRGALALLGLLTLFLPLEEFLLKWVPVGDLGYVVLRALSELALLAALLGLALGHRLRGLSLARTPLDLPLVLFTLSALASLLVGGGSVLAGAVNLRPLLRFVPAFYLLVWLRPTRAEGERLVRWLLCGALLQVGIGLLQAAQGGAGSFWLPAREQLRLGVLSRDFSALAGGLEQGAVLGTTDHSVAFAVFLLVGATVAGALLLQEPARAPRRRALLALLIVLCGVGILFSYSRGCLLALGLNLGVIAWVRRREPLVRRGAALATVAAPLALALLVLVPRASSGGPIWASEKEVHQTPLESFERLFSERYLESTRFSRLWILRDVGSEIVTSAGGLGFGPDEEHVKRRLLGSGGARLQQLLAYRAFEDVYWVALLAYYGFLGLGLFLWLLARIARLAWAARDRPPPLGAWALALFALVLASVPLGFLVPLFDFRTFAFYFWVLAALVVAGAREGDGVEAQAMDAALDAGATA